MGICMEVWEKTDKIAAVCVVGATGLGARSILGRWNRRWLRASGWRLFIGARLEDPSAVLETSEPLRISCVSAVPCIQSLLPLQLQIAPTRLFGSLDIVYVECCHMLHSKETGDGDVWSRRRGHR
jgi:hypothetical protein